ncbi:MAG: GTP-binding protein [Cellulophaga sp.]
MKTVSSEIILRPRFQLELNKPKELLLSLFEIKEKEVFLINRVDDHVFIKYKKEHVHFWSPQLHIEISEIDNLNSKLNGLFGPSPSLWTFFMFLHFGCSTLFMIFAVWAYTNNSLGKPINLQIGLMALMVLVWFLLYSFGRVGKNKGKIQMNGLYSFMKNHVQE